MAHALKISTLSKLEMSSSDVSDIVWNSQNRTISIGNKIISLTPSEYRLLFPLRHGQPVTYEQLASMACGYALDDKVRIMMDKHIDRIRSKISGSGIYIYCVLRYGYILLHEGGSHH